MDPREELIALRRLAALEAKASGSSLKKSNPSEYDPESPEFKAKNDPTAGQSFGENLVQGIGAGMAGAGRALGLGGMGLGLPATREEATRLDAPLDATTGGKIGRVVGIAAPASLAIPFTPATIPGAVTAGALTGGLLTEGDLGDRATGAGIGGAGGLVAGALPYAYQAGKGLLRGIGEPLTQVGRERIAGRAIERFSTNPNALTTLTNAPTQTGARLTLAEAAQDPGLMTLQRAIGTADPEAAAMLGARQEANNAARLQALQVLSGGAQAPLGGVRSLNRIAYGQPTREAAEATRSAAANASYGSARNAGVDQGMADALAPQISQLLERPEIQRAAQTAREYARSEGLNLGDDLGSVQGLQYLKKALDDQIEALPQRAKTARRLFTQSSSDLKSVLDDIAPALRQADREFQLNSVPVNRAAIGERLLDKTTGALRDFSGNRRLQANAFAKALNDEEALIAQATGFKGNRASLDDILTATQSGRVNATRNELETLANLNSAANGPGSQTAKMLASQNLLRQVAGPLGLPDSWVESVLAQSLLRPVQFAAKAGEARIGQNIADAMLDPSRAAQLVRGARSYDQVLPPNALQLLLQRSAPALIGANAAR